jgi:hypothetical protein
LVVLLPAVVHLIVIILWKERRQRVLWDHIRKKFGKGTKIEIERRNDLPKRSAEAILNERDNRTNGTIEQNDDQGLGI